MRPQQATEAVLALLVGQRDARTDTTEAILRRAGLDSWEIATLTGAAVSATPKPLPFWATELAKRSRAR
jgi:hypothetical protein